MTGHDLDLDARAAEHYESVGSNHRCRICNEWSLCTVERLRAKLAVAEQERDGAVASMNGHHCHESAERAIKRAVAAEARLAAVRKLCDERLRWSPDDSLANLLLAALDAGTETEPDQTTCGNCGHPYPGGHVVVGPGEISCLVGGGR